MILISVLMRGPRVGRVLTLLTGWLGRRRN